MWLWDSVDWSINTLRLRQNGRHFPDGIFECIFLNENVWISIYGSNEQYCSIGSDDSLAPTRRQAIIWTSDGEFIDTYVSLGLNELDIRNKHNLPNKGFMHCCSSVIQQNIHHCELWDIHDWLPCGMPDLLMLKGYEGVSKVTHQEFQSASTKMMSTLMKLNATLLRITVRIYSRMKSSGFLTEFLLSVVPYWWQVTFGLDDGLASIQCQAII